MRGQREKRAARVVRRRVAVAGVLCAIVLVTAALVFAGGRHQPGQHVDVAASSFAPRSTAASSTVSTATQPAPSTEGSTFPSTTETATTVTADASATDDPSSDTTTTTATTHPPLPEHAVSAVLVETPTVAGRFLKVSVTIKNRKTDDWIGLRMVPEDSPAYWNAPSNAKADCTRSELHSEEETFVWNVQYKVPGHHSPTVVIVGCGPTPDTPVALPIDIEVEGPTGPSNGAYQPAIQSLGWLPYWRNGTTDPSLSYLWMFGADWDGAVDHFVIDWGDGTPPEVVAATIPDDQRERLCDPTREYEGSETGVGAGHHYSTDGPHNPTVTIVSTGCDGVDPHQQSTATLSDFA